jgi:riboflavin kinase/FMN adenylyltransferase
MTFSPHPRAALFPDSPPRLLYPDWKKIRIMAGLGVRAVVTIPFTREFAALTPEEFVREELLSPPLKLAGVCVGRDWRFGAGAAADTEVFRRIAEREGFEFAAVDELRMDGEVVSSTAIRRAITGGMLGKAQKMLGAPYSVSGVVGHGRQIAGKVLGCPTANLMPDRGVMPPRGVYAGLARADGAEYPAVAAIGAAPTFRDQTGADNIRFEVHIIGFSGNLYGKTLEFEFREHLREELCFSSAEALRRQIELDVTRAVETISKSGQI